MRPGVFASSPGSRPDDPSSGGSSAGRRRQSQRAARYRDGADAVVPIEEVEELGDAVTIGIQLRPGSHVRSRAGDLAAGALVVGAGVRLKPAQLGALAAAGVTVLRCRRAPRVTVAVTGTELKPPGGVLGPGEIYDANGLMLAAQARSAGAAAVRLPPIVGDDLELTRRAVGQGLAGDVLITSGGVSVGPHDYVRRSLAAVGVEEVFWRVALRPGKPIAFAVRERTLVFGLPGNPVSSLVCFELFVRPALLALQGVTNPRPVFLPGRLGRAVTMLDDRECLLRARTRVDGDAVVLEPLSGQESHMIARAAAANALVLIPRGEGEQPAGKPRFRTSRSSDEPLSAAAKRPAGAG